MEDEMANKFTKTDQLEATFQEEKARLVVIQKLVKQYKHGLSK